MKINTDQENFLSKNFFFFNLSLLAGNFTMEKKVCYFELCLVLIKKNSKSFGGKNLASSTRFFFSSKAMDIFCFNTRLCSNAQNFFPFRQPSIRKKRKRDSLYFDLLPGPLNSADFLNLLVLLIRGRRE